MDKKLTLKYEAVDKFLEDMSKKGTSDVRCPFCNTPLEIKGDISASYEVVCQTQNCLKSTYRGI